MVSDKMSSHPNLNALATVAYPYKLFVQESRPSEVIERLAELSSCSISGGDCRAAYEAVLAVTPQETRTCGTDSVRDPEPKKCQVQYHLEGNQWINALMKEASQNNVQGIINLVGNERELNVTDQFGWTMLMCAAHAGATEVVEYLLKNGAETKVRDKGGNTCTSIAKQQKHYVILNLFKSCVVVEERELETSTKSNKIFCDVCKHHFEETPSSLHKNSTVHLFNSHPRKCTTWYGIPDSNKGFKLMIKNGWNREQGLGPEGSGPKFPPKTVLKRDRRGLGISSGIARVTHFKPHDTSAIERKNQNEARPRRERKIFSKSQVSSDKRKERYWRRELNF